MPGQCKEEKQTTCKGKIRKSTKSTQPTLYAGDTTAPSTRPAWSSPTQAASVTATTSSPGQSVRLANLIQNIHEILYRTGGTFLFIFCRVPTYKIIQNISAQ